MPDRSQNGDRPIGWVREIAPMLRPFRTRICFAGLAIVLDAVLTALRPWPLKVSIHRVLSHKPTRVPVFGAWINDPARDPMHALYGACTATLLIALGTGLLTYYYTHGMGEISQRAVFALRRALFAHAQRLSLRFHDRQRTGDLLTRLTADVSAIGFIVDDGFILLLNNGCLLIAMLAMMLWLNWRFALAALSVVPPLFWTVFWHTRRVKLTARSARTSDGLVASLAQETLASIRIVQGLAQEDQQDDRFHDQSEQSLKAHLKGVGYQARVAPLVDLLAASGLMVVMWYGATRVLAGALTTGDMIVFFAYVTNFYSPIRALSRLSFRFGRAEVGAERIAEVLDVRSEVVERSGARPLRGLRGEIEFRGVSFAYEAGHPVLSQINLRIAPGKTLAIVGETGAGKSTLVSLVPRFFDPSDGEVRFDGEDIRNYQVQSLREHISLVLQDSLLFSGTIRDNIAFGRPDASDTEIVAAAVAANADSFIRLQPDGYDTAVAERGTSLSGGQKQRIAIARAILRDAPILI